LNNRRTGLDFNAGVHCSYKEQSKTSNKDYKNVTHGFILTLM
jgi:hypothetical protein